MRLTRHGEKVRVTDCEGDGMISDNSRGYHIESSVSIRSKWLLLYNISC